MILAVCFQLSAHAALIELKNVSDFENLIHTADVPVLVQFSAYWCGPCQVLTGTLKKVAPSYSDDDVLLAKVDAHVNPSLQKYLKGGYPTVRTFNHGTVASKYFVGAVSEPEVRNFIDGLIADPTRDVASIPQGPFCAVE